MIPDSPYDIRLDVTVACWPGSPIVRDLIIKNQLEGNFVKGVFMDDIIPSETKANQHSPPIDRSDQKVCYFYFNERFLVPCDSALPAASTQEVIEGHLHAKNEVEEKREGDFFVFWRQPWGEPVWVDVPAGEFHMGEGWEQSKHFLKSFRIAQVPITNAQYELFVRATGYPAPEIWIGHQPLQGLESHPVVNVSWYDAMAYCAWLSKMTGSFISLASEIEWEKAARGEDRRTYPWGDRMDASRCNTRSSMRGQTSPVGSYPGGVSPYGCFDMSGNVWEWTRSLWRNDNDTTDGNYGYPLENGKSDNEVDFRRVLRGGCWDDYFYRARCAFRLWYDPRFGSDGIGFRVVMRDG